MANGAQSLAHLLRQYRQRLGVTQAVLAGRAGVDTSYVGHVERGRPKLHFSRVVAESLATALELSYTERAALLVACGYWPFDGADVELLALVAEVLQSPVVAESDRSDFALVVFVAARWCLANAGRAATAPVAVGRARL